MPQLEEEKTEPLHPSSCLGFSGGVLGGLHAMSYRGEPFIAFPLGAMVVVKHAARKEGVTFLQGHNRVAEGSWSLARHPYTRLSTYVEHFLIQYGVYDTLLKTSIHFLTLY